jgi:hypothetical protein
MLPIPLYSSGFLNPCDSTATLTVATPSYWYDASLPISTSLVTGENRRSGTDVINLFDRGTSEIRLNDKASFVSWWQYDANFKQNDNRFYSNTPPTTTAYRGIFRTGFSTFNATAGKGTLAMVYYLGEENYAPFDGSNIGSGRFQFVGTGNNIRGWSSVFRTITGEPEGIRYVSQTTIIGDNKTYQWHDPSDRYNLNRANKWYVRIVSVPSIGNTTYAKENGVNGSVVTYNSGTQVGDNRIIIESQAGANFAECMFWQTPLSLTDCIQVENYLRSKWCINY